MLDIKKGKFNIKDLQEHPEKIPLFSYPNKVQLSKKDHKLLEDMSNNMPEILNYIFEATPSDFGTRCFLALQSAQPYVIDALLNTDVLQTPAFNLLNKKNPPILAICRLAGILTTTIRKKPKSLPFMLSYIFQLLNYIDNPEILDFFYFLSGPSTEMEEAQNYLLSLKYDCIVIKQIQAIDGDDIRLKYLFKVVAAAIRSKILYPIFAKPNVVETLIEKRTQLYADDKWETVLFFYTDETKGTIYKYIDKFLYNVTTPIDSEKGCSPGLINSLGVIVKMLINDPDSISTLNSDILYTSILRLLKQFPNNIFLLKMVEKFVMTSFKIPEMASVFAPKIITFALDEATSRRNPTLAAMSYQIIEHACFQCKRDEHFKMHLSKVKGCIKFIRKDLHDYLVLKNTDYGGEIEEIQRNNNFLSNFMNLLSASD